MNRKIFIIGTGAIGKCLAVFLTASGRDAVLIKGRYNDGEDEKLSLRVNLPDNSHMNATVQVSNIGNFDKLDGIVVLATKSIGNDDIAQRLSGKCGDSPVVILQNGLNIEEALLEKGIQNVFRCVLYATCHPIDETTLQFKPVAPSPIGCVGGDRALLDGIVSLLDTLQFQFAPDNDIQTSVWRKVIANCVFNSICPLLETDNGIFHRNDKARSLAEEIIEECVFIAKNEGVAISSEEVLSTVMRISKASDGVLISTLQDIRNRRPTEIDTLNFAIVKSAIKQGRLARVRRTKMLGDLVKVKSLP